jgi:hypothetical protein
MLLKKPRDSVMPSGVQLAILPLQISPTNGRNMTALKMTYGSVRRAVIEARARVV